MIKESFKLDNLMNALDTARSFVCILKLKDGLIKNGMVLRHDVDLDVEPAYVFSRRLEEIGVQSTFLFLTTCETYNVSTARNRTMIRQMAESGFEIGLHFDPIAENYTDESNLMRRALAEKSLLEDISGTEVTSMSLHNPGINGLEFKMERMVNAYDPRLFGPDIYASDSRMKEVDIIGFASRNRNRTSQLLLHPMHYSNTGDPYPIPMINYVLRHIDHLDEDFRKNAAYESARCNVPLIEHVNKFAKRKRTC